MLVSRRVPALAAALALPALALPALAPPAVALPALARAAALPDGPDCSAVGPDEDERKVSGSNTANAELQVAAATRIADAGPREDVRVVVVDTDFGGFDRRRYPNLTSAHGLTVAGIVGGKDQSDPTVDVGIAPAARLDSEPFYMAPAGETEEGELPPTAEALAAALRRIKPGKRTIVLVPTAVRGSTTLKSALARLHKAGALVVAAAGDRPAQDRQAGSGGFLDDYGSSPQPGEDAAADVWPAADDDVLTVGISDPRAAGVALRNSSVDIAAPGYGAVSVGLQGGWCTVNAPSTSWAAAQVAGIAALVWSVHGDDSAATLRTRLEGTASGNGQASPLTGSGMVQAVEALQRPLEGLGDEGRRATPVRRGEVPAERADLLAGTREDAVWWGLAGGGALVVLLVLRPVLARRRR